MYSVKCTLLLYTPHCINVAFIILNKAFNVYSHILSYSSDGDF